MLRSLRSSIPILLANASKEIELFQIRIVLFVKANQLMELNKDFYIQQKQKRAEILAKHFSIVQKFLLHFVLFELLVNESYRNN